MHPKVYSELMKMDANSNNKSPRVLGVKEKVLSAHVSEVLYKKIEGICAHTGVAKGAFLRDALNYFLDHMTRDDD